MPSLDFHITSNTRGVWVPWVGAPIFVNYQHQSSSTITTLKSRTFTAHYLLACSYHLWLKIKNITIIPLYNFSVTFHCKSLFHLFCCLLFTAYWSNHSSMISHSIVVVFYLCICVLFLEDAYIHDWSCRYELKSW